MNPMRKIGSVRNLGASEEPKGSDRRQLSCASNEGTPGSSDEPTTTDMAAFGGVPRALGPDECELFC